MSLSAGTRLGPYEIVGRVSRFVMSCPAPARATLARAGAGYWPSNSRPRTVLTRRGLLASGHGELLALARTL